MIKLKQIDGDQVKRVKKDTSLECETCCIAKLPRNNFAGSKSTQAERVGDAIHSDLCGPLPRSLGNNYYFATYIDEKSDYIMMNCIEKKSDNFGVLKRVREEVKTQAGVRMKKLVSDGGGEYISKEVKKYLDKKGIIQQLTPPDTPQLNGKSERLNRTLMNQVRAMLREKSLPSYFWGEALRYAIFLRNRMSKRGMKRSRFEEFRKRKPAPFRPEVFGSLVYYKNNSKKKKKLDARARRGVFVGINEDGTYRIYDVEKKVVQKSRDVKFFANSVNKWSEIEEEDGILYLEKEKKEIENEEENEKIGRWIRESEEEGEEDDDDDDDVDEEREQEIQQAHQVQPIQQEFIQQPRQQRKIQEQ